MLNHSGFFSQFDALLTHFTSLLKHKRKVGEYKKVDTRKGEHEMS